MESMFIRLFWLNQGCEDVWDFEGLGTEILLVKRTRLLRGASWECRVRYATSAEGQLRINLASEGSWYG